MASKRITMGIAASLMPFGAMADSLPAEVRYRCDRNAEVRAIYVNPKEAAGLAVLYIEGQLVALQDAPAASGAFYTSGDGEIGYRWHVKGKAAFLTYQAEGASDETVLLNNCVAAP
ncbi:MliC family protein [Roseovarius sp. 2305UL8-3]|uniref:MliC family protein n=1 Tax=Roseovarius conchicola TaxID=3121636 RepID=UPI0035283B12